MKPMILDNSQVKAVRFDEFRINCLDDITMEATYAIGDVTGTIVFKNVSEFRFNQLNWPVVIHGFEVIDHSSNGWEDRFRYEIGDYEDGLMRFYCQEISVTSETSCNICKEEHQ